MRLTVYLCEIKKNNLTIPGFAIQVVGDNVDPHGLVD
jgi:hypothetical protein